MRACKGQTGEDRERPAPRRFPASGDPTIARYVARLRSRFGKYLLPPEEARRIVDESMGEKTLTELLYRMRSERP